MRIGVWYDLPSGGALRALAGQLRELHALGHDIAVWTPDTFGERDSVFDIPTAVERFRVECALPENASFLDRRLGSPLDLNRRRAAALERHAAIVCEAMRRWNADVLFVHPCWWSPITPLARYWHGASLLYLQEGNRGLHEASPSNPWAASEEQPHWSPVHRIAHRLRDNRDVATRREMVRREDTWARAFDRVLVNSMYSREVALRTLGLDAKFCPLGVDQEPFISAPRSAKEHLVVSVGLLSPNKGAMLAIETLAAIPAPRRPPLHWIANRIDEVHAREVTRAAADAGVQFRLSVALSDTDLARELGRAACFLFCPRLEPLGLAPLEANLARTPVVGVAEGGVRETIVNGVNGWLVTDRDPNALARHVERLTSDLQFSASMGETARAHAMTNHSWRQAGLELERQLTTTITHARARAMSTTDSGAPR